MKKVIRLTESDLMRIVKRVINEQSEPENGDVIKLLCVNPLTNNSKVISPVEFSNYLDKSEPLPDKLVVKRPSNIPSDEAFSSDGEYILNIELITDPKLKQVLNITNDDTYMMTYNVGGRFYCTPKRPISATWDSFFTDKKIKS
jgi:hypothetical protein